MFIWRSEWEAHLVQLAELRGRETGALERKAQFVKMLASEVERCQQLQARVKVLEGALLDANDKLFTSSKQVAEHLSPVDLGGIFEEDEELVQQDRALVKKEGTSDILFVEEA